MSLNLTVLLAVVFVICFFCSVSIYKNYKKKHPEKYYGGKIYSATLKSITPEIKVCTDLSKKENIINAKTVNVATIAIQQTSSDYYYREVTTGKLIPVSYEKIQREYPNDKKYYCNYTHCVFIKIGKIYEIGGQFIGYKGTDCLENISSAKFQEYLNDRTGKYIGYIFGQYKEFDSFSEYLDFIFDQGEKFYKDSESQGQISEDIEKENALKKFKANQKKQEDS